MVISNSTFLHFINSQLALKGPDGQSTIPCQVFSVWRRGGIVVSALDFQSGGQWFEPSLCRHVVSLDKKLYMMYSHCLSSPRCIKLMGTGDHNAGR